MTVVMLKDVTAVTFLPEEGLVKWVCKKNAGEKDRNE